MHRFILHNREILDTTASTRIFSPAQVGLLNGWGVFSTIRVYDGVLFAWERHWARMKKDAARLRIPFPSSPDPVEEDLYRLLSANGLSNTVVRVTVIRNKGGLWQGPPPERDFDILAYTRDVTKWGPVARLDLVPNGRFASGPFAGAKYLSWAENLTLYENAHEKGLDDALLLNERGEVSECTSANIFAAKGNAVWTPPVHSGCLPGVTRALLLEEVRVPGIQVEERTLLPADLEAADEVFITSSTRELIRVTSVEGLRIPDGDFARPRLQSEMSEWINSYIQSHSTQRASLL